MKKLTTETKKTNTMCVGRKIDIQVLFCRILLQMTQISVHHNYLFTNGREELFEVVQS